MRRTAQQIEEAKEARRASHGKGKGAASQNKRKSGTKGVKGFQPGNTFGNRFQPGRSGNPGGRPKNDVAREIAKAIFEDNGEKIYAALLKALLKGNAYTYKELADRAYGKTRDVVKHEGGIDVRPNLEDTRRRIVELTAKMVEGGDPLAADLRRVLAETVQSGGQSDVTKKT